MLARNSAYNFLGGLVPAVAALLTIPAIVSRLGTDQYGVFALISSIVGYFAVLDINVTAGSTKYIAEHSALGNTDRVNQIASFGLLLYLIIGLCGCLGLVLGADFLAGSVFKIPQAIIPQATLALRIAGLAFFVAQVQSYLLSVPQALQRYDLSGRFDAVFGMLVPCATLLIVVLGGGLAAILIGRLILSIINCGLLYRCMLALLPGFKLKRPDRDVVRSVGSFSAFSYLSRIAAISSANADKLIIAGRVDVSALSLFYVPVTLANRVFGLVLRIGQVIFPSASALSSQGKLQELGVLLMSTTRAVTFLNVSIFALLAMFSREFLHYWAGPKFDAQPAFILGIISLAVFADSLTNLPSLVNDGMGKPRNSGLFAIARAAVGACAAWVGVGYASYTGAAWAQLIMSILMTVAFVGYVHAYVLPVRLGQLAWHAYLPALPVLLIGCGGIAICKTRPLLAPAEFVGSLLMMALALLVYGWFFVMPPATRLHISKRFVRRAESVEEL